METRTSDVLSSRNLHYITEAINLTYESFSSMLAEHNYMKYKFKKRLSDTGMEHGTLFYLLLYTANVADFGGNFAM